MFFTKEIASALALVLPASIMGAHAHAWMLQAVLPPQTQQQSADPASLLQAYVRSGAWMGRRWDEAAHAAFVASLPQPLSGYKIQVLPHGSMATMDYRGDRIRIWLDTLGRSQRIGIE